MNDDTCQSDIVSKLKIVRIFNLLSKSFVTLTNLTIPKQSKLMQSLKKLSSNT